MDKLQPPSSRSLRSGAGRARSQLTALVALASRLHSPEPSQPASSTTAQSDSCPGGSTAEALALLSLLMGTLAR
jgi:hypothetical protein